MYSVRCKGRREKGKIALIMVIYQRFAACTGIKLKIFFQKYLGILKKSIIFALANSIMNLELRILNCK